MSSLTPEEDRLLQQELAGENIVWSGKPNEKVIFHTHDIFLIPFSLLWGGFAIFWELGASKGGVTFFSLWGIPFVLVGQYLIWGRFIYAAWKKRRIFYVLTTQRALVLVRPPFAKTISSYIKMLPAIEKKVRTDGIGSITLGMPPSPFYSRTYDYSALGLNLGIPVFTDIDNADDVYATIERLRSNIHSNA
jgi:hypothetical protein